jgi:hypothetical protein
MPYMSARRAAHQRTGSAFPGARLRPGERPCWLELPLADAEIAGIRRRAARRALPIDARIALLLEATLVDRDLHAAGAPALERLHEQALAEGRRAVLAPTPELRAWVAMLRDDGRTPPAADDLPCIALPTRVVNRVAPAVRTEQLLEAANDVSDQIELAIACETAAALTGRTLESWAYATALQRATVR